MGLLPMCAGLGSPSWNSRNRAPGRSPARGALRGARESRIQLTDGLIRTKETPTSPPAPSYAIIPARSFHPLRVGNAGGELTRNNDGSRVWSSGGGRLDLDLVAQLGELGRQAFGLTRNNDGSRVWSSGGGRLELDLVAQLGELGRQAFGLGLGRVALEVLGAEIAMGDAVFQHMVDRREQRGGDGADRLLRSAAAFQAQELGLIVAALFADRRPGALHQNGLQPGGALAQAGGFALAGAFVLAGAPPRP